MWIEQKYFNFILLFVAHSLALWTFYLTAHHFQIIVVLSRCIKLHGKRSEKDYLHWTSTKNFIKPFFIVFPYQTLTFAPFPVCIMSTFTEIIYLARECITVGKYFHTKLGHTFVLYTLQIPASSKYSIPHVVQRG